MSPRRGDGSSRKWDGPSRLRTPSAISRASVRAGLAHPRDSGRASDGPSPQGTPAGDGRTRLSNKRWEKFPNSNCGYVITEEYSFSSSFSFTCERHGVKFGARSLIGRNTECKWWQLFEITSERNGTDALGNAIGNAKGKRRDRIRRESASANLFPFRIRSNRSRFIVRVNVGWQYFRRQLSKFTFRNSGQISSSVHLPAVGFPATVLYADRILFCVGKILRACKTRRRTVCRRDIRDWILPKPVSRVKGEANDILLRILPVLGCRKSAAWC